MLPPRVSLCWLGKLVELGQMRITMEKVCRKLETLEQVAPQVWNACLAVQLQDGASFAPEMGFDFA